MDVVENACESLKVKSTSRKKSGISKSVKPYKNSFRRVRKNRNKVKYYKSLRQHRYNRRTDDLCSAVEVFDISDMEWTPTYNSEGLPPEVSEWQKQDQIAYWKSRAISLELENRMLHEHLRNVYAKTVEEYLQKRKYTEVHDEEEENVVEENNHSEHVSRKKSGMLANTKRPVSPKLPSGKNRLEEMKKIYGDKAQKIMGMETALQLNYEKLLEQTKPSCWPTISLRLGFE